MELSENTAIVIYNITELYCGLWAYWRCIFIETMEKVSIFRKLKVENYYLQLINLNPDLGKP